jgi:hypothetical protein
MKVGRLTELTFLTYIHSQIGALNMGIACRMTNISALSMFQVDLP